MFLLLILKILRPHFLLIIFVQVYYWRESPFPIPELHFRPRRRRLRLARRLRFPVILLRRAHFTLLQAPCAVFSLLIPFWSGFHLSTHATIAVFPHV